MKLTYEEKMERVMALRPIDDVMFEVLAENKLVCQEILTTIMEDPDLVVMDVIVQRSERNIFGRSVRLDALCTLGNGNLVNIEVQRQDKDDHFRRARFNAASITAKDTNTGERFENIKDLYIIYISEFDFIKGEKTIYHIDKIIRETGEKIDDGLHEIFVNSAVNDHSNIADLMSCFIKKDFNEPKFPHLSSEVKRLKETEGGVNTMCTVMQHYMDISKAEGRAEGKAEGRAEGKAEGRAEGKAEGRAEGKAEGRAEGKAEAILLMAKNMLSNGIDFDMITACTGLNPSEIRRLSL